MLVLHSVHDDVAEVVEYLPTPHSVQELAPSLAPVLVIEPAPQSAHDVMVDAVEYLPALHAVHALAPAFVAVSVIDPAPHSGAV